MLGLPNFSLPPNLDLRNGTVASVMPAMRASSIPGMYNWGMFAPPAGVSTDRVVEGYIREAYGRIGAATVNTATARASVTAATATSSGAAPAAVSTSSVGDAAFWSTSIAAAAADPSVRARAICLGAARAGAIAYWRITDADIQATEKARDSVITSTTVAATGGAALAYPGATSTTVSVTCATALAMSMAGLTDVEMELATVVFIMGAASLPLAGAELLESGHHFLSSNMSAAMSVEKQLFASVSAAAKDIWKANEVTSREMVWHAAGHPINLTVLRQFAEDEEVPAKLLKAGIGSAAVRLPWAPAALRAGKAMIAVHTAITATLSVANYSIEIPRLKTAVATAEAWNVTMGPLTLDGFEVKTEHDMFEIYLRKVIAEASPVIAVCAGVLSAILEESGLSTRNSTLLRGKSIDKLMKSDPGSVAIGKNAYSDYLRHRKTKLDDGDMPTLAVMFN